MSLYADLSAREHFQTTNSNMYRPVYAPRAQQPGVVFTTEDANDIGTRVNKKTMPQSSGAALKQEMNKTHFQMIAEPEQKIESSQRADYTNKLQEYKEVLQSLTQSTQQQPVYVDQPKKHFQVAAAPRDHALFPEETEASYHRRYLTSKQVDYRPVQPQTTREPRYVSIRQEVTPGKFVVERVPTDAVLAGNIQMGNGSESSRNVFQSAANNQLSSDPNAPTHQRRGSLSNQPKSDPIRMPYAGVATSRQRNFDIISGRQRIMNRYNGFEGFNPSTYNPQSTNANAARQMMQQQSPQQVQRFDPITGQPK